ncbi:uncharacterized protein lrrc41 [Synchiropus picturatus]
MAGDGDRATQTCLKTICFQAVRRHFGVIGAKAVADLPVVLIRELLFHLSVCEVTELQPVLDLKGVSTRSFWLRILEDVSLHHASDFATEEELRHEVLRVLFTCVFYNSSRFAFQKHISNPSTFLWMAAKYLKHFLVTFNPNNPLERLVTQQQSLLARLEKHVTCVAISLSFARPEGAAKSAVYVLHRLLDHGAARRVILQVNCPVTLACLLHGEGPSASLSPSDSVRSGQGPGHGPSSKRKKVEGDGELHLAMQLLHKTLNSCSEAAGEPCPRGRLEQLEMMVCSRKTLHILNTSLPKLQHLRSLTLHSSSTFSGVDMHGLSVALKHLSMSGSSSLRDLTVTGLQQPEHFYLLLDSSSELKSISVDIQPMSCSVRSVTEEIPVIDREVFLEKLSVQVARVMTDEKFIITTLKRCPRLTSLHVAGLRALVGCSHQPFLTTLSVSSSCLSHLHLEDLNLSNCLPEILQLLKHARLQELHLVDCRLLERCGNKQEFLKQLVEILRSMSSLHTLSLAHNRIAANVCVLAELFSGSSPSSVRKLDIRQG